MIGWLERRKERMQFFLTWATESSPRPSMTTANDLMMINL